MASRKFFHFYLLWLTVLFGCIRTNFAINWNAVFEPNILQLHMDDSENVLLTLTDVNLTLINYHFEVRSEQPQLAQVQHIIPYSAINVNTGKWQGNVSVQGIFLGKTNIYVALISPDNVTVSKSGDLQVTVIRYSRLIDHIFTGSIVLVVSLLYINFGAALDLGVLRNIVVRPIGPVIAFCIQFIGLPLLSYGLGLLIFPNAPEFQLGLFFTGVSPSGGASNIWCAILNGNINLSVLMTTISNFAAFGMMPLWLFTLGSTIFGRANLTVPYQNIATYAIALVVPLAIGLAIQRWLPRFSNILVRLLKPISSLLILFIIVFAIVTNLYLFKLFSWQIIIAGLALPWLSYLIAYVIAKVLHQNSIDSITIAIETGIQNTGISIFLLRVSLPQPEADLTTVIPVCVAIMTPLPLFALYIYKRFITKTLVSNAENLRNAAEDECEQITETRTEPEIK